MASEQAVADEAKITVQLVGELSESLPVAPRTQPAPVRPIPMSLLIMAEHLGEVVKVSYL